MEKVKRFLAFFFIIIGLAGGVLTYLLKNESSSIIGYYEKTSFSPPNTKVYTYPVDEESGLTGAGIGSGIFAASCLLAGVFLLSNLKEENDVKD